MTSTRVQQSASETFSQWAIQYEKMYTRQQTCSTPDKPMKIYIQNLDSLNHMFVLKDTSTPWVKKYFPKVFAFFRGLYRKISDPLRKNIMRIEKLFIFSQMHKSPPSVSQQEHARGYALFCTYLQEICNKSPRLKAQAFLTNVQELQRQNTDILCQHFLHWEEKSNDEKESLIADLEDIDSAFVSEKNRPNLVAPFKFAMLYSDTRHKKSFFHLLKLIKGQDEHQDNASFYRDFLLSSQLTVDQRSTIFSLFINAAESTRTSSQNEDVNENERSQIFTALYMVFTNSKTSLNLQQRTMIKNWLQVEINAPFPQESLFSALGHITQSAAQQEDQQWALQHLIQFTTRAASSKHPLPKGCLSITQADALIDSLTKLVLGHEQTPKIGMKSPSRAALSALHEMVLQNLSEPAIALHICYSLERIIGTTNKESPWNNEQAMTIYETMGKLISQVPEGKTKSSLISTIQLMLKKIHNQTGPSINILTKQRAAQILSTLDS